MGRVPAEVERFIRRVNRAYKLNRAILFGSRARGDYLKHSDYDIVLVSENFAGIPFTDRISSVYRFWTLDDAVEPLCYTPEEFSKKAGEIGVVRVALREGIEIDAIRTACPADK